MKWIFRLIRLLLPYIAVQATVSQIQSRGLLAYLKLLQGVRKGIIGLLVAVVILQLMVMALVGAIATIVLLTPVEPATKAWALLAVFGGMFLLPFGGLCVLLSERTWFKSSGADRLFERIAKP